MGLIGITDGGETWTLSRVGGSNFHAFTVQPNGGALGYDGVLRRNTDGPQLGATGDGVRLGA